MVELLENRISKLDSVKIVLILGITSLFPNYEKAGFEGLLKSIGGIKKILAKLNPYIIITAPLNKYSQFRPEGGKILAHFGKVLVLINNHDIS